jgi:hypothetical protein
MIKVIPPISYPKNRPPVVWGNKKTMPTQNKPETVSFAAGWAWNVFLFGFGYYPGSEVSSLTVSIAFLSLTFAWSSAK